MNQQVSNRERYAAAREALTTAAFNANEAKARSHTGNFGVAEEFRQKAISDVGRALQHLTTETEPQDTLALPTETIERVTDALNALISVAEATHGAQDRVEQSRAALRELATMTSMAMALAGAEEDIVARIDELERRQETDLRAIDTLRTAANNVLNAAHCGCDDYETAMNTGLQTVGRALNDLLAAMRATETLKAQAQGLRTLLAIADERNRTLTTALQEIAGSGLTDDGAEQAREVAEAALGHYPSVETIQQTYRDALTTISGICSDQWTNANATIARIHDIADHARGLK